MRQDLQAFQSRTDLTEEDLQFVLGIREESRTEGRELEFAHCQLVLAHMVKWVRSDNDEMPFDRATSLALEALPILQRHGDLKEVVSAKLLAVPGMPPDQASEMLDSAMELARSIGDESVVAYVLNRQAAKCGMSDRSRAAALNRESLEIYIRLGNLDGQALCLFSLAITADDNTEKFTSAVRCAELYRQIERFDQAAKAMSLVLMYAPPDLSLEKQRAYAEIGLKDAQQSAKPLSEMNFYGKLARISDAQGNREEAKKFRRWEKEIRNSDGLTDKQRKRQDAQFAKSMKVFAAKTGNVAAEKLFGADK